MEFPYITEILFDIFAIETYYKNIFNSLSSEILTSEKPKWYMNFI